MAACAGFRSLEDFASGIRAQFGPKAAHESRNQWESRLRWLTNFVRDAVVACNGDLSTLGAQWTQMEVLNAAFHNIRILGCSYDTAPTLHETVERFSQPPNRDTEQKCQEIGFDFDAVPWIEELEPPAVLPASEADDPDTYKATRLPQHQRGTYNRTPRGDYYHHHLPNGPRDQHPYNHIHQHQSQQQFYRHNQHQPSSADPYERRRFSRDSFGSEDGVPSRGLKREPVMDVDHLATASGSRHFHQHNQQQPPPPSAVEERGLAGAAPRAAMMPFPPPHPYMSQRR